MFLAILKYRIIQWETSLQVRKNWAQLELQNRILLRLWDRERLTPSSSRASLRERNYCEIRKESAALDCSGSRSLQGDDDHLS